MKEFLYWYVCKRENLHIVDISSTYHLHQRRLVNVVCERPLGWDLEFKFLFSAHLPISYMGYLNECATVLEISTYDISLMYLAIMKVERFIDTESYWFNWIFRHFFLKIQLDTFLKIQLNLYGYTWHVSPGNYLMKNRHLMIGWCCHLARHQILKSLEWSFHPLEKNSAERFFRDV